MDPNGQRRTPGVQKAFSHLRILLCHSIPVHVSAANSRLASSTARSYYESVATEAATRLCFIAFGFLQLDVYMSCNANGDALSQYMYHVFISFQRGSDELLSHSPMVTNGASMSPTQTEVNNDAKKVRTPPSLPPLYYTTHCVHICIPLYALLTCCICPPLLSPPLLMTYV